MAKNLTTRYLFKQYAKITATTDDSLIDVLINQCSQAIAAYCDRVFEATTYRAWLDGTGASYIMVPQWPVTRLYSASLSTVAVCKVENTSAKWANVIVKDGSLYLNSTDGTGAEATEIEAAFATYKDIDALATYISAQTGWSATVETSQGDWSTQLIKPLSGRFAANSKWAELEVADEPEDVRMGANTNQRVEIISPYCFPMGRENVFVWYKAGYTLPAPLASNDAPTTDGNVPDDLTMACNQVVKAVLDGLGQKIGAMKSEKFDNYSYAVGDAGTAIMKQAIVDQAAVLIHHKSGKLI